MMFRGLSQCTHSFDGLTDGRTDGQTDRQKSLDRVCIPCSPVKRTILSAKRQA